MIGCFGKYIAMHRSKIRIWTVVFSSLIGPIEDFIWRLKSPRALGPALTLQGHETRGPAGPGLVGPAKKGDPRAAGPGLARPWRRPWSLGWLCLFIGRKIGKRSLASELMIGISNEYCILYLICGSRIFLHEYTPWKPLESLSSRFFDFRHLTPPKLKISNVLKKNVVISYMWSVKSVSVVFEGFDMKL